MRRIGIMGGTFNPIHNAHLQMAQEALRQAQLDQIWFMPSKKPPHKQNIHIASETDRSQMIQLAIDAFPDFIYSDFELIREGVTYTADTLSLLSHQYPEDTFYFILGGDSLFQIENWYHPECIMESTSLLVICRETDSLSQLIQHIHYLKHRYSSRIQVIQMPAIDISSSQIRNAVFQNHSILSMVPPSVADYIQEKKLYHKQGSQGGQ